MTTPDDTLCAFPWEMYSADSGFGWWRPCPRIDFQKLEDRDFFNHARLRELRQNLRAGVRDPLCQRCWDDECRGVKSYRQVLKQEFKPGHYEADRVEVPKILEIKFSNLCNLKCVFCANRCSSLWEREQPIAEEELGPTRGHEVGRELIAYFVRNSDLITTLQVFGGEPVLHPEFDELVTLLADPTIARVPKELSLSTNLFFSSEKMSKFLTQLSDVLDRGHRLYLRVSIDGVGAQGEYLRTGLKWSVFDANLVALGDMLRNRQDIGRVRANIALNILNLTSLDTIMEYLKERKLSWIEPHYNYVGKPARFMLQSYGSRLAEALRLIVNQDFHGYEKYKRHVLELVGSMVSLEPDFEAIGDCRQWLDTYDRASGRDFRAAFPRNGYLFGESWD